MSELGDILRQQTPLTAEDVYNFYEQPDALYNMALTLARMHGRLTLNSKARDDAQKVLDWWHSLTEEEKRSTAVGSADPRAQTAVCDGLAKMFDAQEASN